MLFIFSVTVFLFVAPAISTVLQHPHAGTWFPLFARWLTFWACGVRLFLAGIRQTIQPGFTAKEIFQLDDARAYPIVREVGFGNLAMGLLGLATIVRPAWLIPAALTGGLYYGLAGLIHLRKHRNPAETFTLITDFWVFAILAVFVFRNF